MKLSNVQSLPPNDFVRGWVNQADGRGTLDIIWSCLSTTFLCSWTVLCLNIPAENESVCRRFCRKLRWMALTVFGPEFTLAFAVGQWASARRSQWAFHLLGYPQWTLRHAFFADMGGLVLKAPDYEPFPVNATQVHFLVARGYLPFPDIAEEVIKDKNKAGGLTRWLTVLQTCWFFVQCIGRWAQDLSVTTLEVSTIAFVLCTVPTSLCWYRKPLDIDLPIRLDLNTPIDTIRAEAQQPIDETYNRTPFDFVDPTSLYWSTHYMSNINIRTGAKRKPIERSTNDKILKVARTFTELWLFIVVLNFACVHLLAWNFQTFPTSLEHLLWRISATLIVGLTLYHWAVVWIAPWCQEENARQIPLIVFYLHAIGTVAYGLARVYLICEAFVGLRALPASVFRDVEWSAFIPHI